MRAIVLLVAAAASLLGQASRDIHVEADAPPLPDKRERWALVVGISSYKYVPPPGQLKYAHRDAEEFARFLRSPQGGSASRASSSPTWRASRCSPGWTSI